MAAQVERGDAEDKRVVGLRELERAIREMWVKP